MGQEENRARYIDPLRQTKVTSEIERIPLSLQGPFLFLDCDSRLKRGCHLVCF